MNIGHISYVDHGTIHTFDGQVAQFQNVVGCVVQTHAVFHTAYFLSANRHNQILCRQRIGHILRRKISGLECCRIQINLNQALLTPIGVGNGGPWNGDQGRAHRVDTHVEQVLL